MSKYNFYYDESEHSRKINYKAVSAYNYYDNFVTMIVGWLAENFLWYNSVGAFALAGTVFCRSNRKRKGVSAYENADRIYLPFGIGA